MLSFRGTVSWISLLFYSRGPCALDRLLGSWAMCQGLDSKLQEHNKLTMPYYAFSLQGHLTSLLMAPHVIHIFDSAPLLVSARFAVQGTQLLNLQGVRPFFSPLLDDMWHIAD